MDLIEKYSQIYWSPFLTWVFMWINAIEDIVLFVDGPDCIFYKADMLYKTHDLFSKLKDASTDTKLYFSWVMPNKMVRWYDEDIKRKLWFIESNSKFNLWIITCMPVTGLLANQYENIYRDMQKDFIFVPSQTDKFRIDWYSYLLRELAKYIKIDKTKEKNKLSISLIWYLYDRNEGDCIWNIEEIKRLLFLIWVSIDSIWLDGGKIEDLSKIESSSLLVSLPYWKLAIKVLSKKLEVDYIDLEVPFWLKNTVDFVRWIWIKLWIDKEFINDVLKKEFSIVKEKIDLLDNKVFLWKKYIYAWDPFLETSIIDIWKFLWMEHLKTYFYTWSKNPKESDYEYKKVDFVIWNSEFNLWSEYKLEFWFPSYNTHFLTKRAYMWFEWTLNFVERLYNKINEK